MRSKLSYSTARKSINLCALMVSKVRRARRCSERDFRLRGCKLCHQQFLLSTYKAITLAFTKHELCITLTCTPAVFCSIQNMRELGAELCCPTSPPYYIYTIKRYGVLHNVCPHQPPSSSPGAINGFPLRFEDYTQSPTPEHILEHENVDQSH